MMCSLAGAILLHIVSQVAIKVTNMQVVDVIIDTQFSQYPNILIFLQEYQGQIYGQNKLSFVSIPVVGFVPFAIEQR